MVLSLLPSLMAISFVLRPFTISFNTSTSFWVNSFFTPQKKAINLTKGNYVSTLCHKIYYIHAKTKGKPLSDNA